MGHNENSPKMDSHSSLWMPLKKKLERGYRSRLISHFNTIKQKEANSPKRSWNQEVIKFSAKINQVETKEQYKKKIKQTGSLFFETINKIDKPLDRMNTEHKNSIQFSKTRNQKGEITTEI